MNTKHDAIVLLGFSGAGKDTCFRELDRRFPSTYANAKFGALHKLIVAKVFDLNVSELEDKSKRMQPVSEWYNLSPFDLLTVLYRGITPRMRLAYCTHVLNTVNGKLPVFTDVRTHEEATFVNLTYRSPLFIYIWSADLRAGVNDEFVSDYSMLPEVKEVCRDGLTVEETVDLILEIANGN